jgi:hypothetical protein
MWSIEWKKEESIQPNLIAQNTLMLLKISFAIFVKLMLASNQSIAVFVINVFQTLTITANGLITVLEEKITGIPQTLYLEMCIKYLIF